MFVMGEAPPQASLQVSLCPTRCPTETNDILPLETMNKVFWELVLSRIAVYVGDAYSPTVSWHLEDAASPLC